MEITCFSGTCDLHWAFQCYCMLLLACLLLIPEENLRLKISSVVKLSKTQQMLPKRQDELYELITASFVYNNYAKALIYLYKCLTFQSKWKNQC